MSRRTKTEKYLARAKTASEDSTCLRRRYGAVIVKNDAVIAEGYNGSPRKQPNCTDLGFCERDRLGVPKGERYELCVAVHAEQNAIIQASRNDMIGATLYIYGEEVATGALANPAPCLICSRMIVNAGIKEVIGPNGYYWKVPLEGEEVIPIGEYKKDAVCTCGKSHGEAEAPAKTIKLQFDISKPEKE